MKKHTSDKYIEKVGTKGQDSFEQEFKLELLGEAIKKARKDKTFG